MGIEEEGNNFPTFQRWRGGAEKKKEGGNGRGSDLGRGEVEDMRKKGS